MSSKIIFLRNCAPQKHLLLHLHKIMEGLYFHCSLSVCLFVCMSVCLSGSACEQNSSRTDELIWTQFSLNGCLLHWLKPIEIGDLGSKVKVTVTLYPFFLHISLLTSLLCISALLCSIKMKFSMWLSYTLGPFVFQFHKNRMGDDVIMTSIKFSPNNCSYLKFYWSYKLCIWNKYITTQCPSNDKNESDLDRRWRSQAKVKGDKKWTNGHITQTITLTDIILGIKVQYNKRHQMS